MKSILLLLAAALCCGAAKAQSIAAAPRPTTSATAAASARTAAEVGDSETIETSRMAQEAQRTGVAPRTEPAAQTAFDHDTTINTDVSFNPGTAAVTLPEYAYCEIIAGHLPGYQGHGVLFDFGQKTEAWAYNRLEDAEGRQLLFASKIEALNYMVCRGWEFVQAYTSGEENGNVHYLLRIPTTALSAAEKQLLLTPPQAQEIKKSRKKK